MRLRALLFAMVSLGGIAAGAWMLAERATAHVERMGRERVREALAAAGHDWAGVATDGLIVRLSGTAPDETTRFRAMEIVRQVVAVERIEDATAIAAADPLAPPPFALELLRDGGDVSLIGLVPGAAARAEIAAALEDAGLGGRVTDMLETAEHTPPRGWEASLDLGLELAADLASAKISVAPGQVGVIALAESSEAREALQARLADLAPDGVILDFEITAPRPVIAPFAAAFALEDGAGRLEACSADSAAARTEILAAAGLAEADCAVGLGAPTPDWGAAVAAGIAAVRDLGGGRFEITGTQARLTGPVGVAPETMTEAGEALAARLPEVVALTAVAPPPPLADAGGDWQYAPHFIARLGPDGGVRLSGALPDAASEAAVASYARALFGHGMVEVATAVDPDLPEGWPGRVLAGIEALAGIREGAVTVTPETLRLAGWSISDDAAARAEALLSSKAGPADVEIRFDAAAAEAAAIAARPLPEICAEDIGAILDAGSIGFAPGSAEIDPASQGVIAAIADVLRTCPGGYFEIGGHTDAQGGDAVNLRLSQARAEAVQAALEDHNLPLIAFDARGYGATRPVGDNATAAGRAANRRIEFAPVTPEIVALRDAEQAAARPGAATCAAEVAAVLDGATIEFGPGSVRIEEESEPVVAALAGALAACPASRFEVAGHTDSQGREDVNEGLSLRRAEAVMARLQDAIPEDVVLSARGYGEARPVADNDSEEGRARNRRIEVVLLVEDGQADADGAASEGPSAAEAPVVAGATAACGAAVAALLGEAPIVFGLGSAEIDAASAEVLEAVAGEIAACPDAEFEIGGHTDTHGRVEVNRQLSQERAEAVVAALAERGVAAARLSARGYGSEFPVADNDTAEGRALNRRIEVTPVAADGNVPAAEVEGDAGPVAAAATVGPDDGSR